MKRRLAILGVAVLLLGVTAACATYDNSPGPPTPPTVLGIEWAHDGASLDCGLGILADGSAFVTGVLGHPFLSAGITWLGWAVTGESYPPGGSVAACWNWEQANIGQFNLYTQCYGAPVLKSTWTSFSGAQAWVQIPACRYCNQACQAFANFINPIFDRKADYCEDPLAFMDLLCFALNHPVNRASVATEDTLPPGTTTDLPWPSDMVPPGWNVNTPIPTLPS